MPQPRSANHNLNKPQKIAGSGNLRDMVVPSSNHTTTDKLLHPGRNLRHTLHAALAQHLAWFLLEGEAHFTQLTPGACSSRSI